MLDLDNFWLLSGPYQAESLRMVGACGVIYSINELLLMLSFVLSEILFSGISMVSKHWLWNPVCRVCHG